MTLAHSAVGAAGAHTTSTPTATFPFASPAAGDVALLFTVLKTNTLTDVISGVTAPGGGAFTEVGTAGGATGGGAGTQGGVDIGKVRIQLWRYECLGTEATGDATATLNNTRVNSSVTGRLVQFTKASGTTLDIAVASGEDATGGTPWSVTFGTDPGIVGPNDLIYTFIGNSTDVIPTYSSSALTATGATFTENFVANPASGSGNDSGGRIEWWGVTGTASSVATHTITLGGTSTNAAGAEFLVRIREVAAPTGFTGWGTAI